MLLKNVMDLSAKLNKIIRGVFILGVQRRGVNATRRVSGPAANVMMAGMNTPSRPSQPDSSWPWLLALAALTLLSYQTVWTGPFFFDDEHFIEKNRLVHDLTKIKQLFLTSVTEGAGLRGNFYRPLQQLAFAVVGALFGFGSSLPFHLLSIGAHLVAGSLLWLFCARLGISTFGRVVGVGVFFLHPVQSEAVAYVSGLSDPLGLCFMLSAVLLLLAATTETGSGALGAAATVGCWLMVILALLTKETGVILAPWCLAVVAVRWWDLGRRPQRREWLIAGGAVALVAGYLLVRLTILDFGGGLGLARERNVYTENLAIRLSTFVSVLWDYARVLVWPRQLSYEKPYLAYGTLVTWRGVFGLALILTTATALAVAWWRRRPRLLLGLMLVVTALVPFIGIIPLNSMWLEHWLYGPLAAMAILLGASVDGLRPRLGRQRLRLLGVGLMACGVAASFRTAHRAGQWADPEGFYLNEIAAGHANRRTLNNLGMHYAAKGDLSRAETFLRRAIAAEPADATSGPEAHHNLARVLWTLGKTDDCLGELRIALSIDHRFPYSLGFLREVLVASGQPAVAAVVDDALRRVAAGEDYDFRTLERAVFGSSG